MNHGYVDEKTHRIMACLTEHIASRVIVHTMTTLVHKQHGLVTEGNTKHIACVYPRFICLGLFVTNHSGDLSSRRTIIWSSSLCSAITAQLGDHSWPHSPSRSCMPGPPRPNAASKEP
ncbi:hypothetical protein DPMN_135872 [Dreissena polymorpha]|uniref:Uncharacterized protein n=1 Tax=Dreissena polymorpha TaxID=45954 RepID=A0A9D4JG65_DREPO|nr:hypothetical protein DPMN_135872 [Dreissena polymorpha]